MEYLYHVNFNDDVIGKIDRETAHKDKLLHRAGVVFVWNAQREIYLTIRSEAKTIFPNCVDCACSFHVQYGQTYDEAAKQELWEETKLKDNPKYCGKFLLNRDPDYMVVAVYNVESSQKITLDPSEANQGKFYSIEEANLIISTKETTSWLKDAWFSNIWNRK